MKRLRFNQQEIVFAVFAVLFLAFSIFLRGFLYAGQHADAAAERCGARHPRPCHGDRRDRARHRPLADRSARGAAGLVLQMVQNGHSLPASLLDRRAC